MPHPTGRTPTRQEFLEFYMPLPQTSAAAPTAPATPEIIKSAVETAPTLSQKLNQLESGKKSEQKPQGENKNTTNDSNICGKGSPGI